MKMDVVNQVVRLKINGGEREYESFVERDSVPCIKVRRTEEIVLGARAPKAIYNSTTK